MLIKKKKNSLSRMEYNKPGYNGSESAWLITRISGRTLKKDVSTIRPQSVTLKWRLSTKILKRKSPKAERSLRGVSRTPGPIWGRLCCKASENSGRPSPFKTLVRSVWARARARTCSFRVSQCTAHSCNGVNTKSVDTRKKINEIINRLNDNYMYKISQEIPVIGLCV